MPIELKTFTINVKSLDQHIDDPIVAGAGDANGRTLRLLFCQEAAAQFTERTKVYLKWYHQERNVSGYNVFTQVNENPPIWEIHWPKEMLYEGNVLCTFELVDDVSIAPSVTFAVHVLSDPHDGSDFIKSNDYSVFQEAVINMNSFVEATEEKVAEWDETIKGYDNTLKEFDEKKIDKTEFQEKLGDIPQDETVYQYINNMFTVTEF